jgi:hypothetical protein
MQYPASPYLASHVPVSRCMQAAQAAAWLPHASRSTTYCMQASAWLLHASRRTCCMQASCLPPLMKRRGNWGAGLVAGCCPPVPLLQACSAVVRMSLCCKPAVLLSCCRLDRFPYLGRASWLALWTRGPVRNLTLTRWAQPLVASYNLQFPVRE